MLREDVDLSLEILDIAAELGCFGRVDDIAPAKIARAPTKGQMDVNRERVGALFEILQVGIVAKRFTKFQRGGVAGVTGAGLGVAAEFFEVNGAQKVSF
jgi:hypothetical protein